MRTLLALIAVPLFLIAKNPLIISNQEFAWKLFNQVEGEIGNLIISPFSVQTALYMTYMGTKELSDIELKRALSLDVLQSNLPDDFRLLHQKLFQLLRAKDKPGCFFANALWGKQNIPILPVFLFTIQKNFYGNIENVSFSDPASAAKIINDWTSSKTQKHFRDFIDLKELSPTSNLLITSAAGIKMPWRTPFAKSNTNKAPYFLSYERVEPIHVNMMHQKGDFPFYENDELKLVALPFKEKLHPPHLQLVLILPKSDKKIEIQNLFSWIDLVKPTTLALAIPRFHSINDFSLKKVLMTLGVVRPFSPQADFSKISGTKDFYVSDMIHKARFGIDEEGSEILGSSIGSIALENLHTLGENELNFTADHPFYFAIVDREQDLVLFLGKCVYPDPFLPKKSFFARQS